MSPPRLTLSIPSFGPFFPPDRLHEVIDLARMAEAAGVDTVILPDHVAMGDKVDAYAWGPFPMPIDTPWLEPFTVLAAIAATTTRLRLATGILIAPLRSPALLAKQAATLDVLSQGRLDLGVGVGWQREEFEASDLDFDSRGQRLTDLIAACRALWGPSPTDFASESFSFKKIWCEPKPVQPGGPPVWFSGTLGRRNMDRLTRLGDGWIPIMTATADDLAEGRVRIEDAWSAAGRDPARLKVRGSLEVVLGENRRPDLGATLGGAHELARRGATDVQLPMLAFVRTPDALRDWFDELSTRWREVTRG